MFQFKKKIMQEDLFHFVLMGEDSNCPCEVYVYNTCPTVNQNCSCK